MTLHCLVNIRLCRCRVRELTVSVIPVAEINLGVLGAHTAQRSAALAQKGLYTKSRLNAHMQQRLVSRWT